MPERAFHISHSHFSERDIQRVPLPIEGLNDTKLLILTVKRILQVVNHMLITMVCSERAIFVVTLVKCWMIMMKYEIEHLVEVQHAEM